MCIDTLQSVKITPVYILEWVTCDLFSSDMVCSTRLFFTFTLNMAFVLFENSFPGYITFSSQANVDLYAQ